MPKGPHTVLFHAVPSARGDLPHKEVETFRMLALREHSETTVQVSPSPNPNPNPDPSPNPHPHPHPNPNRWTAPTWPWDGTRATRT